MIRKPHIVKSGDEWACGGDYFAETPYLAFAAWFIATGMAYLNQSWAFWPNRSV